MSVKLADTLESLGDFEVAQAKDISVEIDGSTKMLQTAIDNGEIGGGGSSTFVGTHDEWDALLPTEKEKYEFVDFTDDVDGALIDDTEAHTNKVYSSSKVEDLITIITDEVTNLNNCIGKPNKHTIYRHVKDTVNAPTSNPGLLNVYTYKDSSGHIRVTQIWTDNYETSAEQYNRVGLNTLEDSSITWGGWKKLATTEKSTIIDYSFNSDFVKDVYHEFYLENGTVHIRGVFQSKNAIPLNTTITVITLGKAYAPKGSGGFQIATDAFAKLYSMTTKSNDYGICWIYSDIQIPVNAYFTYEASWKID